MRTPSPPPWESSSASVWTPWGMATRLFGASQLPYLAALGSLSAWRSVFGLATLLILGRGDRSVKGTLDQEGWEKPVITVTISLAIVPVAMAVLYLRTHRGSRPRLRLRPVVTKLILLVLTTFGAMAPIILSVQHPGLFPPHSGSAHTITEALIPAFGGLLALIYGLWAAIYVCCATWWAVRSSCFIGEYHPLLGPAVTAVVVTATTAAALIQSNTQGVSTHLWLVLTLGGACITLGLSAIEYYKLRARHINWRTGPEPSQK
jgi:hypothetical protein